MLNGLPIADLAVLAVALLAAGALTGVLAGLFGVGGGAVIVPILFEVFGILGIDDEVRMPLAVGTSLAIIIPTSIRSFRGHYLKGAVDMSVLRAWAVPVVLGVVLGSLIARYADPLAVHAGLHPGGRGECDQAASSAMENGVWPWICPRGWPCAPMAG